jgi:hypothetical protein
MKSAIHIAAVGIVDIGVVLSGIPKWPAVLLIASSLLVSLGRFFILLASAIFPQESQDRLEWWQTVWNGRRRSSDRRCGGTGHLEGVNHGNTSNHVARDSLRIRRLAVRSRPCHIRSSTSGRSNGKNNK